MYKNSKSFPNINYNSYEDKKKIEKNKKNIFSDDEFIFSEDEEYKLEKKSYKNEKKYYKVNNIKRKFKERDEIEFYFEEIKNEKYIYVIVYLLEFILTSDRSAIDLFNNQIMIKYVKNEKLFELLSGIINENNITNDLLAKYWLRLYTLENYFIKLQIINLV